ncbi:DUF3108 domain-containing protein [Variovorax sp. PAMC 28711]|uniref:DUF3108 domain-containing protein n=1 Tax=Variovorax sp. PAMC 28711 TaxID=1795631 RepID=UPI00078BE705|nr:DUF3108 domain-containing protein [Variovorax sp. PAMC 28711]AMM24352.1 hypothetical protein AX767_08315 [Variovorax sp. PAMC 28711]
MTAHTAPALPDPPRPPWRAAVLLTLAVLLAHLALLFLAPMGTGAKPSPLEARFSTRTIVIAPPPAAEAAAATPAAAPAAPAVQVPARKPPRPRAVRPPKPAAVAVPPVPEPPASVDVAPPAEVGDATASAPLAAASAPVSDVIAAPAASASDAASVAGTGDAVRVTGPQSLRVPGSVKLKYDVSGQQGMSPMKGVYGEVDWLQDGNTYDARLSLGVLFKTLRTQRSTGVITGNGIEPDRFSDQRKVEVASHFVRGEGKVVFSNNAPSVPLLVGAQDRLSVVMQLGAMLAGDATRFPAGSTIAVQTVGPRDADIWTFNVGDEEVLSLMAGEITARKLTRNPRKEFDDKIELWLAPALGYLPVRIKQTQPNGDFADMQLRDQLPLGPPS